jgi:subtilase family serine protease
VQVLIRIKNTGALRCGSSKAEAYIKCPADGGRERKLSVSLSVEALNPGASFVKVYTFRETESSFRSADFSFWIKADAASQVTESNETNNLSNRITGVVPPR